MGDNAMKSKIWTSVAKRLNEVQGGVVKSSAKWSKSWADMKVYTKARAKAGINKTAPINSRRPTELDRRILMVIGQEELLSNWEESVNEDSQDGGASSRQPILEHDYGYQEEGVVIEDFSAIEEGEVASRVIVKDLSDVIKQLKSEGGNAENESMEFYLDDDDAEIIEDDQEEEEIMEEIEPEHVQVDPLPPTPKRQKLTLVQEDSGQGVLEVEEPSDNPVADAIMTLAEAMNNVAAAMYACTDAIKLFKK